jgi:hypothetical protein
MALRRAVVGIGLGMTCGYGKGRVPPYVHEAASAYYLMRLRLLALYQTSHAGRYPTLAAARCQGRNKCLVPSCHYSMAVASGIAMSCG